MSVLRRLALAARLAAMGLLLAGAAHAASAAPQTLPHPPLWKVQKGASTVYLFGSLHILPKDYAWGSPEIDSALAAADRFVFEVPLDEQALEEEKQFVLENGLYLDGRSLKSVLSGPEFGRYSNVLRRSGIPRWQAEHFRPWLASLMLGLAYLHREDVANLRGADETIADYAQGHGKPLRYLETVRDQMTLIQTGDERTQLRALKTLLIRLPRARDQERNLRETWASGDAEKFAGLIEGYFVGRPESKDFLIERRNRAWVAPILDYLETAGTTFVTVGAAHVGGENGVLRLLCNEGYTVERIDLSAAGSLPVCDPKA